MMNIQSPTYGPEKPVENRSVLFDKDLYLAEYNTLRAEIIQRLSHQTTIFQVAITVFGIVLGYALQNNSKDIIPDNKGDQNTSSWYYNVMLISIYPLLALLLSYAWAFNQIRICQIGQYLRAREKEVTGILGIMWWENYIVCEPSIRKSTGTSLSRYSSIKPGRMVLGGTQITSVILAIVMVVVNVVEKDNWDKLFTFPNPPAYMMFFLLLIDFVCIYLAWKIFYSSRPEV